MSCLSRFNNLIDYGIDTDSEVGYKIRHFRICFATTTLCYVFWTWTIVFVDFLGASIFEEKLLGICFFNTSIFGCLFLASFRFRYVRKRIEWAAFISLSCVIVHSILAIRYNPHTAGYWISSTMTYVASIIMLVSRRAILFFSICVSIAYAISILTSRVTDYSMLVFFEIAVVILGIISWTVIPKEVWAFKALARKDERIAKLSMQKLLLRQIGHDLKTPLVSLTALLPRAKARIRNEDAEWREMFDVMMESTQIIQSLVEKVTIFYNLKSGRVSSNKESFPLRCLVDLCGGIACQPTGDRPIKFTNHIDPSISIKADKMMSKQVFINLFSNAVKYASERDLEIQVHAKVEGDRVLIHVVDNGIGMTPEQAIRAFEVFYRADTARSDIASSGLGLAICKEIVHLHDGEIFVEKSSYEIGTSIVVDFQRGGGENEKKRLGRG